MASTVSDLSAMAAGTLAQDTDFIYVLDTSAGTAGSLKMTPTDFLTDRTFTGALTWAGATTANMIKFPDNLADALSFKEGTSFYLTFTTTNSSETVKVTPLLTCAAGISFTGGTGVNLLKLVDNLASALDVTEASNSYLKFTTTNSAETVTITPLLTLVAGASFTGSTGTNLMKLTDNLASALDFTEASNSYLKFTTTNSGETVTITPLLTLVAGASFTGATTANVMKLTDNLADALNFKEGANSYLKFVTTDSAERIILGKELVRLGSAASVDGAITQKEGLVVVTKAGVCAMTIGNPTATTDDYKVLTVISATANAHTLDNSAGAGFNGGGAAADIGTFGGAKGDGITLIAYQGVWYIQSKVNVTLG